jgi:general secretion pathway protein G
MTTRRFWARFLKSLLVIVFVLLALAVVVPRLMGETDVSRIARAQAQFKQLQSALEAHKADLGVYPKSLQDLCANPGRTSAWRGPYIVGGEVPVDPWGNPFGYAATGPHRLWSFGPDGTEDTEDDLVAD